MRICQVLAGNEDGGLEKHTIELSKQLVNRGFDVTVIAHKDFAKIFLKISILYHLIYLKVEITFYFI